MDCRLYKSWITIWLNRSLKKHLFLRVTLFLKNTVFVNTHVYDACLFL
jgi:hypothetical protein